MERLRKHLTGKMGLATPTYIQSSSLPSLLEGRDALLQSPTGSGKTLAYVIPMVQQLQKTKLSRSDGTQALIITPTRELCLQVSGVVSQVLKAYHWMVGGAVMGGEKKKSEKNRLRKGVTVLVATPGRLLDHMQNTAAFTLCPQWIVLDEADRLLDLGFEKDVSHIISELRKRCPERCQSVLVSATLSVGIERIAKLMLNDPVRVGLSGDTQSCGVPTQLKNYVFKCQRRIRLVGLVAFLRSYNTKSKKLKAIVFVNTCDEVEFFHALFSQLTMPGATGQTVLADLPVYELRGSMGQKERTRAFLRFSSASRGVMFCTSVASRGLDIPAVDWIVQYAPPEDVAEYIHRIGRTARMGRKGSSVIFVSPRELPFVTLLRRNKLAVKSLEPERYLDELRDSYVALTKPRSRHGRPRLSSPISRTFNAHLRETVEGSVELAELSKLAFRSFIRSYAAYPRSMKHIFHVRNLHLGQLACSFGLGGTPSEGLPRSAPGGAGGHGTRYKGKRSAKVRSYTKLKKVVSEFL